MNRIIPAGKIFFFGLFVLVAASSNAQQQYMQTVTPQNRYCNVNCTVIDVPALNNNPLAIILASPVLVNGVNPNPNLLGAYYITYLKKWSIYNLNGATMPVGAQFSVEYYVNRDDNHFVYIVPQLVHSYDEAYIDHAGLNNNPDAQVRVFPTTSPNGALYNTYEVRVVYVPSASKWIIANKNNATMPSGVAYNVVFSNGGPTVTNPNENKVLNPNILTPVSTTPNCNCVIPTTLPPNGSAGGDLGGNYPYPRVTGLQGKPVSGDAPAVGQVLKWNGSAWEPANENAAAGSTYNAGTGLAIQGSTIYANTIAPLWNANKLSGNAVSNTSPTTGQFLKWNGVAWEPANENAVVYNAGTGLAIQGSTINANNTAPLWNANKLSGNAVSNTSPTIGQVLKWNGTAWEPAAETVGSNSQTTAKPSVIYFNQSANISMLDPNVNTALITGLDNQTFTVSQSSHITFYTTISFNKNQPRDPITGAGPAFGVVWGTLDVQILDASNNVVGHATISGSAGDITGANVVAVGVGRLPAAGTYHTKISFLRQDGNHAITIFSASYGESFYPRQGGQIIIQIFPD